MFYQLFIYKKVWLVHPLSINLSIYHLPIIYPPIYLLIYLSLLYVVISLSAFLSIDLERTRDRGEVFRSPCTCPGLMKRSFIGISVNLFFLLVNKASWEQLLGQEASVPLATLPTLKSHSGFGGISKSSSGTVFQIHILNLDICPQTWSLSA